MQRACVLFCVLMVLALTASAQRGPARTFDAEAAGAPPSGFTFAAMRQPGPGTWMVRRQGTNGYLAHDADAAAAGFSLAILTEMPEREFVASARLRLAGGARAGGLVWHYQDEQTFYAAVLDLTKQELALYRVAGGNRVRLDLEDDLELDRDAWHTLKVSHDDRTMYVALGGIRVLEKRESRDAAPPKGGRLGVIAAGTAEVWFDDLRIGLDRDRDK